MPSWTDDDELITNHLPGRSLTVTIIDTPQGISNWRLMSAISQLSLELTTGQNFYGKVSVYKAIRRDYIEGLPERATLQNKCLAMRTFLDNLPDDVKAGPVCTRAAESLAKVMAEKGWQFAR